MDLQPGTLNIILSMERSVHKSKQCIVVVVFLIVKLCVGPFAAVPAVLLDSVNSEGAVFIGYDCSCFWTRCMLHGTVLFLFSVLHLEIDAPLLFLEVWRHRLVR